MRASVRAIDERGQALCGSLALTRSLAAVASQAQPGRVD
jgi:hypothetical protein